MRLIRTLALLALFACGDSDPSSPNDPLAGTWSLQSINGISLPYIVLQSGATKLEITSDILTVTSSGTFTQATSIRATQNGVVTTQTATDAGSYTLNGNAVSFVFSSDGTAGTGVLSGNDLSVGVDGLAFIYRKQ